MMSMSKHQSQRMKKDEWLTPPYIISSLGPFDLDPCSPENRPWPTANNHYTKADNGLAKSWAGRVWLNPPYGIGIDQWMRRMKYHGNGIALTFARTETRWFIDHVWTNFGTHSVFFFYGRLNFHHISGEKAKANAGAPSVLISYSEDDTEAIAKSGLRGKLVQALQIEHVS